MDNEQLVSRIQAGIDVSGNMLQLWQQNKGFIAQTAFKYAAYEDIDDLKQEGYFGLCKAVSMYDPDNGARFLTYAEYWIKQAMQRYCENNGAIRLPVHQHGAVRRYKKMIDTFIQQTGRNPTEAEMAGCLGASRTVHQIKENAQKEKMTSLSAPITGTDDMTVSDTIASEEVFEEEVIDNVQQEQLKAFIWPLVDGLQERQAEAIRARFKDGRTLKETADQMGVSPERVRQYQKKAFKELRRSEKLRDFASDYISTHAYRGNGVGTFNRTWTSSTEQTALDLLELEEKRRSLRTPMEQAIAEGDALLEELRELRERYSNGTKI